jgi:hypothetical protein
MNQASVRMGIFRVKYLRLKNKKKAIHLFRPEYRVLSSLTGFIVEMGRVEWGDRWRHDQVI